MKINAAALTPTLARTTFSLVMLMGNDPLLMQEAFDAVLAYANTHGFIERDIIEMNAQFDESIFWQASHTPSLFAEKRIIDLRLSSLQIGDVGSKALRNVAKNPLVDTFLLITAPYDAAAQKSVWLAQLEKAGLLVTVWPIDRAQLPSWILSRLKQANLPHSAAIVNALVTKTEGNLLAAMQHIQKLSLLQLTKTLDETAVIETLTTANHYTVFDLVSSVCTFNAKRALHILQTLQSEKIEPTLILWALCNELRIAIYVLHHQGQASFADLCQRKGVWKKRQEDLACFTKQYDITKLHAYLQQATRIDKIIKGLIKGNVWERLETLILSLSLKETIHA